MNDDDLLGGSPSASNGAQSAHGTAHDDPFDMFMGPQRQQQQQQPAAQPAAAHDDLLGGFEGSLGVL